MIPQGSFFASNPNASVARQPSYTYKLDLDNKRIVGKINELEAVRQAVLKILQTERFAHVIYSPNYGSELTGLVGGSQGYVRSELSRRLREALKQDDRITDIQDIQTTVNGDEVIVQFTVVSLYGTFQMSEAVNASV